ncbi:hypothetical protein N8T08_000624 [Aspergillus melleus]|uniref:Uncharacterized protein n=1 Tax=Aspergillus melleus TaxID=138277 RepID=A0ACC3AQ80_9EURO|nr:hypothetical protein N8T08_000624 [Aspergillus melleus]
MDSGNPQCKDLESPEYKNFILSLLIVLGILLSYLPQHYRIISLKTSYGISPYFVLLGTTSSSSSLANVLSQHKSLQDASCCSSISGFACFAGLLGVLQIATQCFCFFTILSLFVAYFPRISSSEAKDSPSYRTALIVAAICVFHAIAVLIVTVVIGVKKPSSLQDWSNFCGILAAILSSIQYFPQIYTTLKLRCVGSLSIPMMCIQTPGSLVWAGSLAARYGLKGWSTWGVLVVTACLQGTLLALGAFFEYLGPDRGHPHEHDKDAENEGSIGEESQDPSEQTPLLQ